MLTRLKKQISYGLGYIVAALILILILGWAAIRPDFTPDPTPTPAPQFQAIVLEETSVIQHAPGAPTDPRTLDIVARLRNPNPRAGVPNYPVTFILRSQTGEEITRETVTTYLLPGAPQYAVALNFSINQPLGRVEVILPDAPTFSAVPATLSLPRFSSFLRERITKQIGADAIEEQKGIVRNTSTSDWQSVEVVGLALSGDGTPQGVGQTLVGELKIGESREFTLQWPAPSQTTARVILVPTTNIYKDENVIRAIGDPGLLR